MAHISEILRSLRGSLGKVGFRKLPIHDGVSISALLTSAASSSSVDSRKLLIGIAKSYTICD